MNYLSRFLAVCLAVSLTACGGGSGGNAGTPLLGGAVADLFTSAPASLTLEAGGAKASAFVIGGGKRPYTVVSSDSSVVTVGQGGEGGFVLSGAKVGTAVVSIKDAGGQAVTVAVTTRASKDLTVAAPSNLILAPTEKQSYAVSGGSAPYAATSNNSSVVAVDLASTGLVITGQRTGSAQIAVIDSANNRVFVDVTVSAAPPLSSTVPAVLSLLVDVPSPLYKVSGGVPPYEVRASNPGVLSATLSGGELSLKGLAVGSSSLLVTDAAGMSASLATVGVNRPTSTPLAAIPSTATGQVGDSLTFTITGGTPDGTGLYSIRSNNPNIVTVPATGGTSFKASLVAAGSTVVTIMDSLGQVQNVAVTAQQPSVTVLFTTAPPTVVFTNGVSQTFDVGGGTGGYRFQSSNLAVATVPPSGSVLTVTPVEVGTATITVSDSAGTQRSFSVLVQPALPLSTTAPAAGVTLAPSVATTPYAIIGGRVPYEVSSSNPAVVRASIPVASPNVLGIIPSAPGVAAITVTDAAGARTVVNVTVSPVGTSALTVTPGAAAGTVGDVLTFTVSGGTPSNTGAYTVRSNNTNVLTVVQTQPAVFQASLLNAGSTVISVFDSQGQIQNLTVNVASTPTAIRLAPIAITVGESYDLGPNPAPNNLSLTVIGGTVSSNARVFSSDVGRILATSNGRTITLYRGSYGKLCFRPADGANTLGAELPVVITVVDDLGASATMTVTIRNEVTSTNDAATPPQQVLTSCE